jgi:DNA-binding transcriptional MerR regulator
MLRPKDITDQLGISAPTLRVWSNTFAPVLSPGAQSAKTESGGAAQRRYTEQDLAYFRQAKALLDGGSTFEQALDALQALDPGDLAVSEPQALPSAAPSESATPAVIEQTHPVIQAFEEALKAKSEVIEAKDALIATLQHTIEERDQAIAELRARPLPEPPRIVEKPVFRWGWLNRLLTGEANDVG